MADIAEIQELLESVRVTLASSMNPDREQLDRFHNELDAEIRSANKRLRECDTLLADGHRSEAIQLAEQEPNLLELVSILDFPELPEWNDFVAELGLTVTPELQIDIATDLNGAYADDEPLERLMRRFRVHSLARAPLRSRRPRTESVRPRPRDSARGPHRGRPPSRRGAERSPCRRRGRGRAPRRPSCRGRSARA